MLSLERHIREIENSSTEAAKVRELTEKLSSRRLLLFPLIIRRRERSTPPPDKY